MGLQVYGEASVGSEVGLHEHSTLEPTNPYSAAKAGAEMMVRTPGFGFRARVRVPGSQASLCSCYHAHAENLRWAYLDKVADVGALAERGAKAH